MPVTALKRVKTSVPGQYLGYGLQPVRFCFYALYSESGTSASLEHLDDVAVHNADGSVILEQTKSALTSNPTADRSKELWKTLANWADQCKAGSVDKHSTKFRYYVTPLRNGNLIQKIDSATDNDLADKILNYIRSKSFQKNPGVGVGPEIQRFLAAGDDICRQIIINFEFISEANPLDEIRIRLAAVLPEDTVDNFCATAIGMAKDEVERLIRAKKVPILDTGQFRKQFQAFVKKYDFSNLLIPTTSPPSSEEVNAVIAKLPVFVRQLISIEASETMTATAVGDLLRTTSDKVVWAAEGEIVESSLEELDTALLRHHAIGFDEVSETCTELTPQQRGRQLYRKCLELTMKLEERELPTYFVPGEFNALSEDCRLGWHPNYKDLFPSAP